MPSFSFATSAMRRGLEACAISMSDFGDWCCEAGMGAIRQMNGEWGGGNFVTAGPAPAVTTEVQVNLAFGGMFAPLAHSPASIFLPSAGCTRVTLKRPSA